MYTLTLDEQTYTGADLRYLYYPGDDEFVVSDFTVNLSMEECGTVEFTIYKDHPYYNAIIPRISMVTFRRDGKIMFNGQVHSTKLNIDGSMNVYAVDELAFLLDSVQPQRYLTSTTYSQAINLMLNYHNSVMPASKKFLPGLITSPGDETALARCVITTNYEKTLNIIRDEMAFETYYEDGVIVEQKQTFMKVTRGTEDVTDMKHLNLYTFNRYNQMFAPELNQTIRLGHNMQDYQHTESGEGLVTALIPLGAKLDTEVVPGLEARLDITSVNGGVNYITDNRAVQTYGLIFDVVEFDDVTKASNLKRLGEMTLQARSPIVSTYEISAVDLSMVDADFDAFELGAAVRVQEDINSNQSIHTDDLPFYGIIGMNINPLDPTSNSITLVRGIS